MNEKQNVPLSRKETQVLALAGGGMIDKQIAETLGISLGTVRVYWKRLRTKMGGCTRSQTLVALGRGEIALHPSLYSPQPERANAPDEALVHEVRAALAALRAHFPDDCQTKQSLRFRLAVDALLGDFEGAA